MSVQAQEITVVIVIVASLAMAIFVWDLLLRYINFLVISFMLRFTTFNILHFKLMRNAHVNIIISSEFSQSFCEVMFNLKALFFC